MKPDKSRVLLIEDDEHFAEIMIEMIESREIGVLQCSKYNEAIFKLKNEKFRCILLDLQIQGGSGTQLIEMLKTDEKNLNHETPILVMSGHIDRDFLQKFGPKVNHVFVKPFKPSAAVDLMIAITAEKSAAAA